MPETRQPAGADRRHERFERSSAPSPPGVSWSPGQQRDDPLRNHARVAVIGGGALGASLLYHLALRGWTDTVLLEKDDLTNGSTWHAAGLCTQFNASLNVTRLLMRGVELFKQLQAVQPQVPIVFMSGYGYDAAHSIVKARQEGLRGVLFKPFRADQLMDVLGKLTPVKVPNLPEPALV